MLRAGLGRDPDENTFAAPDETRIAVFLGSSGPTTLVGDLMRVTLHEGFVEAEAKDRTLHFLEYDAVLGISVRRPRQESARTGF
jgi:hypothetical protein